MNDFIKSTYGTQYSLYIGRWQPWHEGHRWLIDQRLNEGKNVWIAIRNVKPDDSNPFTAEEVLDSLHTELEDLINQGKVVVSIIPDIESVNYGRGVGYQIIEHVPPTDVEQISATKIRQKMREEGKL